MEWKKRKITIKADKPLSTNQRLATYIKDLSIHFILYYQNLSDEQITAACAELKEALRRYQKILAIERMPPFKIKDRIQGTVYVYGTREQYQAAGHPGGGSTGFSKNLSHWNWNCSFSQQPGIYFSQQPGIERIYGWIHEIIGHALTLSLLGRNYYMEGYDGFLEGFAEYCEHKDCSCLTDYAKQYAQDKAALNLQSIFKLPYSLSDPPRPYHLGFLAVHYTVQKAPEHFVQLIKAFQRHSYKDINTVIASLAEKHQSDFEQWIAEKRNQPETRLCSYRKWITTNTILKMTNTMQNTDTARDQPTISIAQSRILLQKVEKLTDYFSLPEDRIHAAIEQQKRYYPKSVAPLLSTAKQQLNEMQVAHVALKEKIKQINQLSLKDLKLKAPAAQTFKDSLDQFYKHVNGIQDQPFAKFLSQKERGVGLASCTNAVTRKLIEFYPNNDYEKGKFQDPIYYKGIENNEYSTESFTVVNRHWYSLECISEYFIDKKTQGSILHDPLKTPIHPEDYLLILAKLKKHHLPLPSSEFLALPAEPFLQDSDNHQTLFISTAYVEFYCAILEHGGSLVEHIIPCIPLLDQVALDHKQLQNLLIKLNSCLSLGGENALINLNEHIKKMIARYPKSSTHRPENKSGYIITTLNPASSEEENETLQMAMHSLQNNIAHDEAPTALENDSMAEEDDTNLQLAIALSRQAMQEQQKKGESSSHQDTQAEKTLPAKSPLTPQNNIGSSAKPSTYLEPKKQSSQSTGTKLNDIKTTETKKVQTPASPKDSKTQGPKNMRQKTLKAAQRRQQNNPSAPLLQHKTLLSVLGLFETIEYNFRNYLTAGTTKDPSSTAQNFIRNIDILNRYDLLPSLYQQYGFNGIVETAPDICEQLVVCQAQCKTLYNKKRITNWNVENKEHPSLEKKLWAIQSEFNNIRNANDLSKSFFTPTKHTLNEKDQGSIPDKDTTKSLFNEFKEIEEIKPFLQAYNLSKWIDFYAETCKKELDFKQHPRIVHNSFQNIQDAELRTLVKEDILSCDALLQITSAELSTWQARKEEFHAAGGTSSSLISILTTKHANQNNTSMQSILSTVKRFVKAKERLNTQQKEQESVAERQSTQTHSKEILPVPSLKTSERSFQQLRETKKIKPLLKKYQLQHWKDFCNAACGKLPTHKTDERELAIHNAIENLKNTALRPLIDAGILSVGSLLKITPEEHLAWEQYTKDCGELLNALLETLQATQEEDDSLDITAILNTARAYVTEQKCLNTQQKEQQSAEEELSTQGSQAETSSLAETLSTQSNQEEIPTPPSLADSKASFRKHREKEQTKHFLKTYKLSHWEDFSKKVCEGISEDKYTLAVHSAIQNIQNLTLIQDTALCELANKKILSRRALLQITPEQLNTWQQHKEEYKKAGGSFSKLTEALIKQYKNRDSQEFSKILSVVANSVAKQQSGNAQSKERPHAKATTSSHGTPKKPGFFGLSKPHTNHHHRSHP